MTQILSTPWYQEALFYHIYPLGLCGAPEHNTDPYESEVQPRLATVEAWIPHLQELGVNAVYLGPVFESESHGYDTRDYFQVDRRLGDSQTLQNLVQALHRAGIRVVLDAVLNHVGRGHFAFQDLCAKGSDSPYRDWFEGLDFQGCSPYGDPFSYQGWSGHLNLVKLNLKHPSVRSHLLAAVQHWIETFGIDGLRLDAADVMDLGFLSELAQFTRQIKTDFWLMGEVVHGDYTRWANPERLHATTNYECYKGLYSSHNDRNYFEIAHSLNRLFGSGGVYRDLHLYNFVDNHDVNRVASTLQVREHLYPLYLLLLTMPGIPSLYYGSEWGLTGVKASDSDRPLRPALDLAALERQGDPELCDWIARLSRVRHASEALKQGDYQPVYVASEQLAFVRRSEQEQVLVLVNAATHPVTVPLSLSGPVSGGLDLLQAGRELPLHSSQNALELPPCGGRVVRILS